MKLKEKYKEFVKSMSGEAPTPEPTPEPTTGGETPENEQINDELLTAFQADIEAGTLELTEDAVKAWCTEKGLSPESCQELWSMVSAAMDSSDEPGKPDGDEPAPEPTPDKDIQKGGNQAPANPGLTEFQKSISRFKEDQEIMETVLGGLIDENKTLKSEVGKISQLEAEIGFLKSKLGILEKAPVNPKTPGMSANDIPESKEGKAEVVALIMKGIQEKSLTMHDLHKFKVNNFQSEQVKQFIKSQRGNN